MENEEKQCLVRWAKGVNFINMFTSSFYKTDPKSVKIQSSSQYLFALMGSACVKAASETLMKLTPIVNCMDILRAVFILEDPKRAKNTVKLSVSLALLGSGPKATPKTLTQEPIL